MTSRTSLWCGAPGHGPWHRFAQFRASEDRRAEVVTRCGDVLPAAEAMVYDVGRSEEEARAVRGRECAACLVTARLPHDLPMDEGERQLVLLALATLSLRSPGFDDALNRIAERIDNVVAGRAQMYDGFRASGQVKVPTP